VHRPEGQATHRATRAPEHPEDWPVAEDAGGALDARDRLRSAGVCLAVVAGVSAVLAWLLYAQVTVCNGAGCRQSDWSFLVLGVLTVTLPLPAFVEPAAILVADRPGRGRRLRVAGWTTAASLAWAAGWTGLVSLVAPLLPRDDSPILQALAITLVAVAVAAVVLVPLLARRRALAELGRVAYVLVPVWAIWQLSTLGG
jgi:hypothetical protein